jgi:hypothetical protein
MDPVDPAALPQMTITMLMAGEMDPGIRVSPPFPATLPVQPAGGSCCRITFRQGTAANVLVTGTAAWAP